MAAGPSVQYIQVSLCTSGETYVTYCINGPKSNPRRFHFQCPKIVQSLTFIYLSEVLNNNLVTFDHDLCTACLLQLIGLCSSFCSLCSPVCCERNLVCGHNLCAARICVQPGFVWCQRFAKLRRVVQCPSTSSDQPFSNSSFVNVDVLA